MMLLLLFKSRRQDVRSHWGFLRKRAFRGLSSIFGAARQYGSGWIGLFILIGRKCSATLTVKLNYTPNKKYKFLSATHSPFNISTLLFLLDLLFCNWNASYTTVRLIWRLIRYIYIYIYIYIFIIIIIVVSPLLPIVHRQGYIPYPHRAAVCSFKLVFLLLFGHLRGSLSLYIYMCVCVGGVFDC